MLRVNMNYYLAMAILYAVGELEAWAVRAVRLWIRRFCSACSPPLMGSTACHEWARLKDHIIAFLFWSFKTLLITHNLSLNFFAFFSSCKVLFLLKARLFYQGNDNPYSWVSKHSNNYTLDLVPRIKHIFHFQIQLAIPRLFLYL